jgi:adenosylcobinamide-phosphate synthase
MSDFWEIQDFFSEYVPLIFEAERIPCALVSILAVSLIGFYLGPQAGNANPMLWIWADRLLGRLGDRLDKKTRKKKDLMLRGALLTCTCLIPVTFLMLSIELALLKYDSFGLMEICILILALASGSLWHILMTLYAALEKKEDLKALFMNLSLTARLSVNIKDSFSLTRLGVAQAARIFDKAIIAPTLWYLIGGLTALFVTSIISALAWRFGKNGYTKGFGSVPLALDKLLGFVPSVLSAILLTIASTFTPTAGIARSIASWWEKDAPYAEGGHPLAAMAWALNITLGGPTQDLNGSTIPAVWAGPKGATARLEAYHLRRCLYIVLMAHLLWIAALLGAYLWASAL